MNIEPQTLREFLIMMNSTPGGSAFVSRILVKTPEEFVKVLLSDIDAIFRGMESNPQVHYEDLEDKVTHFIASMLKERGYRAAQGQFNGGSVDLTVEGRLEGFKWTAEAKIYRAIDNIEEGFLQLVTRYRPADFEHAKAGMLIYIQREDPGKLLDDWIAKLREKKLENFSDWKCASRPNLAFYSRHSPEFSNIPMEVRHMCLAISYKPKDKSARGSKKHNKPN